MIKSKTFYSLKVMFSFSLKVYLCFELKGNLTGSTVRNTIETGDINAPQP